MDGFEEEESINEELMEFAIRESVQDACRVPQTSRYEPGRIVQMTRLSFKYGKAKNAFCFSLIRKKPNTEVFLKIMTAIHKGGAKKKFQIQVQLNCLVAGSRE